MSLSFHTTHGGKVVIFSHWGEVVIFLVANFHHFAINILEEEDIVTNSLFSLKTLGKRTIFNFENPQKSSQLPTIP